MGWKAEVPAAAAARYDAAASRAWSTTGATAPPRGGPAPGPRPARARMAPRLARTPSDSTTPSGDSEPRKKRLMLRTAMAMNTAPTTMGAAAGGRKGGREGRGVRGCGLRAARSTHAWPRAAPPRFLRARAPTVYELLRAHEAGDARNDGDDLRGGVEDGGRGRLGGQPERSAGAPRPRGATHPVGDGKGVVVHGCRCWGAPGTRGLAGGVGVEGRKRGLGARLDTLKLLVFECAGLHPKAAVAPPPRPFRLASCVRAGEAPPPQRRAGSGALADPAGRGGSGGGECGALGSVLRAAPRRAWRRAAPGIAPASPRSALVRSPSAA
jgi:hypothetical protein